MNTTFVLHNVAQIDHAELDVFSMVPRGYSYNISVKLTTEKNDAIDFFRLKKEIDDIMKHKTKGFDHKLWVFPDFCKDKITIDEDDGEIEIVTPYFKMIAPSDSVRYIENGSLFSDNIIQDHLNKKLNELYPSSNIKADIWIHDSPPVTEHVTYFRYIHGLRDSSNWDEQNMNHGHKGWFAVVNDEGMGIDCDWNAVYSVVDDAIFVNENDVLRYHKNRVTVQYQSKRGFFESVYDKENNNVIIITGEPTLENMVAWFADRFKDIFYNNKMKDKGVKGLWLNESLSHGAIYYW